MLIICYGFGSKVFKLTFIFFPGSGNKFHTFIFNLIKYYFLLSVKTVIRSRSVAHKKVNK